MEDTSDKTLSIHHVGCATGEEDEPIELIRIEIEKVGEHVGLGHIDYTTFQIRMIWLKDFHSPIDPPAEKISTRHWTSFYTGETAWGEVKNYVKQYCIDRDADMLFDLWDLGQPFKLRDCVPS